MHYIVWVTDRVVT